MKRNKISLMVAALVILAVVLSFKFGVVSVGQSGNTKTFSPSPVITSDKIGQSALDFSLTTIDGNKFRLADVKGKTVILFGMAGWCGTCITEGRALTKVKQDYSSKGVEIIGVAFTKGDNNDFLNDYKKVGGIDIPIALDTDNVAQKYNLTRLETTYIINKDGIIVYKDEITTSYEKYKEELDKII